jgi:O-antigen/teichoic acid export membrane protein
MSIRRSLGITTLSQAGSFVLSLGSTMIISRLLSPAEVGVYSVAMALVTFGHLLRDFGVGNYLIQVDEVTRPRLQAAFAMMLSTSWLVALVLYLLREPAAAFYRDPGVARVIGVLALNFVLLPFGAPLLTLLRRELRFGWIAVINLSSQTVHATVTILAALAGQSYLSLAWGSLAGVITTIVLVVCIRPAEAFILPRFRGIREVLQFSTRAFATALLAEAGGRSPDLIFGRTLGLDAVAYYSRGQGLPNLAVSQIVNTAYGIFLPAFAKEVRDGGNPRQAYNRAATLLSGVTMPVAAVLCLLAIPAIELLFGSQWSRSGPLAAIFCLYQVFRSPFYLASAALTAAGKVGLALRVETVCTVANIAILMTSTVLSLEQVVLMVSLWVFIAGGMDIWGLRRGIGLGAGELWRATRSSLVLVPMAAAGPAVLVLWSALSDQSWPALALVAGGGVLAAAGWLLAVFSTGHPLAHEIRLAWQAVRPARGGA